MSLRNGADRTTSAPTAPGWISVSGGHMVGADGNPVIPRGVGLGSWLLPEGYMWRMGAGADSPLEMEAQIERFAGEEYGASFWSHYRDAFISEKDIALIASLGFDHVRVPMLARALQDDSGALRDEEIARIDRVIEWCRAHGLHALLDLHGAPGGQTGTNIDDSRRRVPELFMERHHQELTIQFWKDVAYRYRDEPTVMGYDLLNEPLPLKWQHVYPRELVSLYRELTDAIREVDNRHLIMYEGTHWSTNWEIFDEVWDPNSVLQFHKYWNAPDRASIESYLATRERLGLPIYMGEGGENHPDWLYTVSRLYDSESIGWNFWTWKKVETLTSPLSVKAPEGWDDLTQAFCGAGGLKQADAVRILDDFLEAVQVDQCVARPEISQALLGAGLAELPAWGYGHRGEGVSYEVGGKRGDSADGPKFRKADPIAVEFARPGDNPENPFDHADGLKAAPQDELAVVLQPGDWVEYEISGVSSVDGARVIDADSHQLPVDIELTDDGVRVRLSTEATHAVRACRIVLEPKTEVG